MFLFILFDNFVNDVDQQRYYYGEGMYKVESGKNMFLHEKFIKNNENLS
jgi:hypothetical protein